MEVVEVVEVDGCDISSGPGTVIPREREQRSFPGQAVLREEDILLSPVFIDFLARWLDGMEGIHEQWFDQRSESLSSAGRQMRHTAEARLQRVVTHPTSQTAVSEVYRFLRGFCSEPYRVLQEIHSRFDFVVVAGIARTGGSYLTGELFKALGFEPERVPAAIAHDGIPEASPVTLMKQANAWLNTLMSASEYLVMLGLYFSSAAADRRVIVPKKLTKGIYAPHFFKALFGANAEYLVTIRNPVAACISTYEKSGGLPAGGCFRTRSAIERWIKRDLFLSGISLQELRNLNYFSAYVLYWEQFYIKLALSGLVNVRTGRVVPFGKQSMEEVARGLHDRYGGGRSVSEFVSSSGAQSRHPEWEARSDEAIGRVASVWQSVGLPFPVEELRQCQ